MKMKKLFMLMSMVVAMCVAFASLSCNKNDDDKNPHSALVGTWKHDAPSGSSDRTLVLKADKTGTWERGSSEDEIILWIASDEVLTIQLKGDSYSDSYSYYISNGYLILGDHIYEKQ